MVYSFSLTNPELAYIFGFLQTDGHLRKNSRNRGCLEVELQTQDRPILDKFMEIIPVSSTIRERTRDTNFKSKYVSVIWSVYDLEFRTALNKLGLSYGKKSQTISIPTVPFSEIDYWRGIIDGDGSLGMTAKQYPFISLITTSPSLHQAYTEFLFKKTGQIKMTTPNKRDNAYNICLFKENAQKLIDELYYPGCLCLDRKLAAAELAKTWVRPADMIKRTWEVRKWTPNEDTIVLKLPYKKAAEKLGRTEKSIKTRAWRLRILAANESTQ